PPPRSPLFPYTTLFRSIPYLLAAGGATGGWHLGAWRYLGLLPLGAGIAGIARCLRDFAVVGRGTPAPFDPPRELVATGLYRWVRDRKSTRLNSSHVSIS